jgi:MoaA/NifB/PqqE/SkfB family radical SAM enzyme
MPRFKKVYLEITNVCNRDCAFCPGTRREPRFLEEADFLRLIGKLRPWTDYLYFHLMGEPLLHPCLGRFLTLAGERGFRVILTTNGTLLPEAGPVLLAAPALHKLNLSLHSFEANAGTGIEDYVNQCASFGKLAAARGILVNFRLWNGDSALRAGWNTENTRILELLAAAFPRPWTPSRTGERLAERVYLDQAEIFDWPDPAAESASAAHGCYGLRDQIGVLADGTVVPCCLDHEGDLALGNLLTEDLADILERPRVKTILEGFRRGEAVEELCKRCGYATRFAPRL